MLTAFERMLECEVKGRALKAVDGWSGSSWPFSGRVTLLFPSTHDANNVGTIASDKIPLCTASKSGARSLLDP